MLKFSRTAAKAIKSNSLKGIRNSSFLINKNNLNDNRFYDPNIEYPDLSHLSLEESVAPLREYFDFELNQLPPENISSETLVKLLGTSDPYLLHGLHLYANHICELSYGNMIYLRGIIEFSNLCEKNCSYCGIRSGNSNVTRYKMRPEEIVELAVECWELRYGTLMLQSGEISKQKDIDIMSEVIEKICEETNNELCVALSIGELSYDQYQQLYDAGARRYLLRIESSSEKLYSQIHPEDHLWSARNEAIDNLMDIGFFTGTGVLINIPNQTLNDLANDILYLVEKRIDMVGMGPYLIQNDTPLADEWLEENDGIDLDLYKEKLLNLSLNMLSLTRIMNPYSNMSATTALQLLSPKARERGLHAGGNVVMPVLTPPKYRENYKLYERKQTVDNVKQRDELFRSVLAMGKELNLNGSWGDPLTKKMYGKK